MRTPELEAPRSTRNLRNLRNPRSRETSLGDLRRTFSNLDPSEYQALGRAVKVIYALLKSLPEDVAARVVFMQRDLGEVVASQCAMLARSGNPTDILPPERMIEIFRAQVDETLTWVSQQPHLQLLEVAHAEAIRDPAAVAGAVAAFLGGGLDVAAMAAVPDPTLYRQCATASVDQSSETPVRS